VTGPQPTQSYGDIASWVADQLLGAVQEAIAAAALVMPANIFLVHGTGTPLQDPCEGMMWARVATSYPTGGDGNPFIAARGDFSIPAWAHPIEVGILHCRPVIDENGAAIDFDAETSIAVRDGDYRMALLDGIANRFPPAVRQCVMATRISGYTPIGPDGGWSGGIVVVTAITSGLSRVVTN
jgi:hypothetical protein